MTISLYSGTPGSGKSLHAANDIRRALHGRRPRPVVANFALADGARVDHPEWFTHMPNADLSPGWLVDYADAYWATSDRPFREDHVLLVLDECQLLFNSREWSSADRLSWLEFFSQHRKYGYRVVFVAQAAKMVDNQFRMLVEVEVNHRKMSSAGTAGWLMSLPFGGRLFVWVSYLFQLRERLGAEFYVARRADMSLYDSLARFQAAHPKP